MINQKNRINTRAKGSRLERKVKKHLEAEGWLVIKQSNSAFPDLFAIKSNEQPLGIECKWQGYLNVQEKIKFVELRLKYNIKPLIATSKKGKILFKDL